MLKKIVQLHVSTHDIPCNLHGKHEVKQQSLEISKSEGP